MQPHIFSLRHRAGRVLQTPAEIYSARRRTKGEDDLAPEAARAVLEEDAPRTPPLFSSRSKRMHRTGGILLVATVTLMQIAYWDAVSFSWGETSTLLIALVYCAAGFIAAGILSADADERLFWRLQTLSGGCVFIGRAYLATVPLWRAPSLSTYLDLLAAGVFVVALALTTRFRDISVGSRLRYIMDAAAFFVAMFVLFAVGLLPALYASHGATSAELVSGSFYGAAGAVMLFGTFAHLTGPGRKPETWEVLLVAGFGIAGFALLLWPYWYVHMRHPGSWPGTPLVEVLWVAGVGLLGLAAAYRITAREVPWRPPAFAATWWPTAWGAEGGPWAFLCASVIACVIASFRAGPLSTLLLVFGAIALTLIAVTRSTISTLEAERYWEWSDKDSLTGLLEPTTFRRRFANELDFAARHGEEISLILIDVDDFAYINHVLGYQVGDGLLRDVARALTSACTTRDIVARLEGDSFAVLMPKRGQVEAEAVWERIQERVSRIRAGSSMLTVSAGLACYPRHAGDSVSLLRAAEDARRVAKCVGKDELIVHDSEAAVPSVEERARMLQERSQLQSVRLAAEAVDSRSGYTQGHSLRVAELSVALASRLGLSKRRVRAIEVAALVHDVGKVGVPDSVLARPAQLTPAEWEVVWEHPGISSAMVAGAGLRDVATWVNAHHERWDGLGYPMGLAGEAIPLEARILALADACDAMLSDRPYRRAMSYSEVFRELRDGLGTQFDPLLAQRMTAVLTERARQAS